MVKADVKHNYYGDLDLPSTCTIDDIKKQYRKLALQYHPDRNAGKEEEYVPKFQAIQTAHEILGDPTTKAKYDADRRKAGLYPGAGGPRPPQPTGNPYTATSAYPPPPRRTQPGTWQRPPPSAAGATPSGADRFSNFGRGAPTARKDPAQDRTNMFRAWQNMNNAQERPNRPASGPQTPNRSRPPPPPPRDSTRMPTEDEIRAGMNHRKAPPRFDADRADYRQSAWAAFQQANNAPTPGISRSNTHRTPKKHGFDPNAPGSDERPSAAGGYVHRHKSADFGRPGDDSTSSYPRPPPPPPRPPFTPSPMNPASPVDDLGHPDPLRPFKSRTFDDVETPFAEMNRERTPYGGVHGEKTTFSSDGLRRSASSHDTTKLNTDARSRARSTSPPRRQQNPANGTQKKPIVDYSTSESSEDTSDVSEASQRPDLSSQERPFTAPDERPKKTPTTRRKQNTAAAEGSQFDAGSQGQNGNMYARPYTSPSSVPPAAFDPVQWASAMFGAPSTQGTGKNTAVPHWAFPSSVSPRSQRSLPSHSLRKAASLHNARSVTSTSKAVGEEYAVYRSFRGQLQQLHGSVPDALDMSVFIQLLSLAQKGETCGDSAVDSILRCIVSSYSPIALPCGETSADKRISYSFEFPHSTFATASPKSRSEEQIDTSFSPKGWDGTFSGTADYFAPPKPGSRRGSPSTRYAPRTTLNSAVSNEGIPPGPTSNPAASEQPTFAQPNDVKFSKEEWEKTFKDASWTWPPPPPNPPSPSKSSAKPKSTSRKASRVGRGTSEQPYVVDDDGQPVPADGDAMDIDPPPTHQEQTSADKEPRLYSVPPSAWRQQQQNNVNTPQRAANLAAKLDDLANVAPFAPRSGEGLQGLGDLGATLPFPSQAAAALPTQPLEPQKLQIPSLPRAPEAPSKLTKLSWQTYAQQFGQYLRAYHAFNTKLLQHFTARENQAQARMSAGLSWLEAVGDTSSGFGGYLQAVREDASVRETWLLGAERHAEATEMLERVRERVKRLVATGALVDR